MNRRQFLTTLAAVPLAGLIPAPLPIPGTWGAVVRSETPFFRGGNPGGGKSDIVAYITSQMNLHVHNPSRCFRLDGITTDGLNF